MLLGRTAALCAGLLLCACGKPTAQGPSDAAAPDLDLGRQDLGVKDLGALDLGLDLGVEEGCQDPVDDYAGCCYEEPLLAPYMEDFVAAGARLHGVNQRIGIDQLLPHQGYIYWSLYDDDDVYRVPASGCHVEHIPFDESRSGFINVAGGRLLLSLRDDSGDQRWAKLVELDPISLDVRPVAQVERPFVLGGPRGDGDALYWLMARSEGRRLAPDSIQVMRLRPGEAAAQPYYSIAGDHPSAVLLAVVDGALYLELERLDERWDLAVVPTSTSAVQTLYTTDQRRSVALRPQRPPELYFFEDACEDRATACQEWTSDCCGARLQRLDPRTGALSVLAEERFNAEFIEAPSVTESFAYWRSDDRIMRVSLITGELEALIDWWLWPKNIAVQDGRLYWVNRELTGDVVPGPLGAMILSKALEAPW